MNSFTPYLTGALAFIGGFAGMLVYDKVSDPPTWLIVTASIVAYLIVGIFTARLCWPSINATPAPSNGPPNEFFAVVCMVFWPIALPCQLIFVGTKS